MGREGLPGERLEEFVRLRLRWGQPFRIPTCVPRCFSIIFLVIVGVVKELLKSTGNSLHENDLWVLGFGVRVYDDST